jgi:DNA repair exonuclease SbcCD ATPase subunit
MADDGKARRATLNDKSVQNAVYRAINFAALSEKVIEGHEKSKFRLYYDNRRGELEEDLKEASRLVNRGCTALLSKKSEIIRIAEDNHVLLGNVRGIFETEASNIEARKRKVPKPKREMDREILEAEQGLSDRIEKMKLLEGNLGTEALEGVFKVIRDTKLVLPEITDKCKTSDGAILNPDLVTNVQEAADTIVQIKDLVLFMRDTKLLLENYNDLKRRKALAIVDSDLKEIHVISHSKSLASLKDGKPIAPKGVSISELQEQLLERNRILVESIGDSGIPKQRRNVPKGVTFDQLAVANPKLADIKGEVDRAKADIDNLQAAIQRDLDALLGEEKLDTTQAEQAAIDLKAQIGADMAVNTIGVKVINLNGVTQVVLEDGAQLPLPSGMTLEAFRAKVNERRQRIYAIAQKQDVLNKKTQDLAKLLVTEKIEMDKVSSGEVNRLALLEELKKLLEKCKNIEKEGGILITTTRGQTAAFMGQVGTCISAEGVISQMEVEGYDRGLGRQLRGINELYRDIGSLTALSEQAVGRVSERGKTRSTILQAIRDLETPGAQPIAESVLSSIRNQVKTDGDAVAKEQAKHTLISKVVADTKKLSATVNRERKEYTEKKVTTKVNTARGLGDVEMEFKVANVDQNTPAAAGRADPQRRRQGTRAQSQQVPSKEIDFTGNLPNSVAEVRSISTKLVAKRTSLDSALTAAKVSDDLKSVDSKLTELERSIRETKKELDVLKRQMQDKVDEITERDETLQQQLGALGEKQRESLQTIQRDYERRNKDFDTVPTGGAIVGIMGGQYPTALQDAITGYTTTTEALQATVTDLARIEIKYNNALIALEADLREIQERKQSAEIELRNQTDRENEKRANKSRRQNTLKGLQQRCKDLAARQQQLDGARGKARTIAGQVNARLRAERAIQEDREETLREKNFKTKLKALKKIATDDLTPLVAGSDTAIADVKLKKVATKKPTTRDTIEDLLKNDEKLENDGVETIIQQLEATLQLREKAVKDEYDRHQAITNGLREVKTKAEELDQARRDKAVKITQAKVTDTSKLSTEVKDITLAKVIPVIQVDLEANFERLLRAEPVVLPQMPEETVLQETKKLPIADSVLGVANISTELTNKHDILDQVFGNTDRLLQQAVPTDPTDPDAPTAPTTFDLEELKKIHQPLVRVEGEIERLRRELGELRRETQRQLEDLGHETFANTLATELLKVKTAELACTDAVEGDLRGTDKKTLKTVDSNSTTAEVLRGKLAKELDEARQGFKTFITNNETAVTNLAERERRYNKKLEEFQLELARREKEIAKAKQIALGLQADESRRRGDLGGLQQRCKDLVAKQQQLTAARAAAATIVTQVDARLRAEEAIKEGRGEEPVKKVTTEETHFKTKLEALKKIATDDLTPLVAGSDAAIANVSPGGDPEAKPTTRDTIESLASKLGTTEEPENIDDTIQQLEATLVARAQTVEAEEKQYQEITKKFEEVKTKAEELDQARRDRAVKITQAKAADMRGLPTEKKAITLAVVTVTSKEDLETSFEQFTKPDSHVPTSIPDKLEKKERLPIAKSVSEVASISTKLTNKRAALEGVFANTARLLQQQAAPTAPDAPTAPTAPTTFDLEELKKIHQPLVDVENEIGRLREELNVLGGEIQGRLDTLKPNDFGAELQARLTAVNTAEQACIKAMGDEFVETDKETLKTVDSNSTTAEALRNKLAKALNEAQRNLTDFITTNETAVTQLAEREREYNAKLEEFRLKLAKRENEVAEAKKEAKSKRRELKIKELENLQAECVTILAKGTTLKGTTRPNTTTVLGQVTARIDMEDGIKKARGEKKPIDPIGQREAELTGGLNGVKTQIEGLSSLERASDDATVDVTFREVPTGNPTTRELINFLIDELRGGKEPEDLDKTIDTIKAKVRSAGTAVDNETNAHGEIGQNVKLVVVNSRNLNKVRKDVAVRVVRGKVQTVEDSAETTLTIDIPAVTPQELDEIEGYLSGRIALPGDLSAVIPVAFKKSSQKPSVLRPQLTDTIYPQLLRKKEILVQSVDNAYTRLGITDDERQRVEQNSGDLIETSVAITDQKTLLETLELDMSTEVNATKNFKVELQKLEAERDKCIARIEQEYADTTADGKQPFEAMTTKSLAMRVLERGAVSTDLERELSSIATKIADLKKGIEDTAKAETRYNEALNTLLKLTLERDAILLRYKTQQSSQDLTRSEQQKGQQPQQPKEVAGVGGCLVNALNGGNVFQGLHMGERKDFLNILEIRSVVNHSRFGELDGNFHTHSFPILFERLAEKVTKDMYNTGKVVSLNKIRLGIVLYDFNKAFSVFNEFVTGKPNSLDLGEFKAVTSFCSSFFVSLLPIVKHDTKFGGIDDSYLNTFRENFKTFSKFICIDSTNERVEPEIRDMCIGISYQISPFTKDFGIVTEECPISAVAKASCFPTEDSGGRSSQGTFVIDCMTGGIEGAVSMHEFAERFQALLMSYFYIDTLNPKNKANALGEFAYMMDVMETNRDNPYVRMATMCMVDTMSSPITMRSVLARIPHEFILTEFESQTAGNFASPNVLKRTLSVIAASGVVRNCPNFSISEVNDCFGEFELSLIERCQDSGIAPEQVESTLTKMRGQQSVKLKPLFDKYHAPTETFIVAPTQPRVRKVTTMRQTQKGDVYSATGELGIPGIRQNLNRGDYRILGNVRDDTSQQDVSRTSATGGTMGATTGTRGLSADERKYEQEIEPLSCEFTVNMAGYRSGKSITSKLSVDESFLKPQERVFIIDGTKAVSISNCHPNEEVFVRDITSHDDGLLGKLDAGRVRGQDCKLFGRHRVVPSTFKVTKDSINFTGCEVDGRMPLLCDTRRGKKISDLYDTPIETLADEYGNGKYLEDAKIKDNLAMIHCVDFNQYVNEFFGYLKKPNSHRSGFYILVSSLCERLRIMQNANGILRAQMDKALQPLFLDFRKEIGEFERKTPLDVVKLHQCFVEHFTITSNVIAAFHVADLFTKNEIIPSGTSAAGPQPSSILIKIAKGIGTEKTSALFAALTTDRVLQDLPGGFSYTEALAARGDIGRFLANSIGWSPTTGMYDEERLNRLTYILSIAPDFITSLIGNGGFGEQRLRVLMNLSNDTFKEIFGKIDLFNGEVSTNNIVRFFALRDDSSVYRKIVKAAATRDKGDERTAMDSTGWSDRRETILDDNELNFDIILSSLPKHKVHFAQLELAGFDLEGRCLLNKASVAQANALTQLKSLAEIAAEAAVAAAEAEAAAAKPEAAKAKAEAAAAKAEAVAAVEGQKKAEGRRIRILAAHESLLKTLKTDKERLPELKRLSDMIKVKIEARNKELAFKAIDTTNLTKEQKEMVGAVVDFIKEEYEEHKTTTKIPEHRSFFDIKLKGEKILQQTEGLKAKAEELKAKAEGLKSKAEELEVKAEKSRLADSPKGRQFVRLETLVFGGHQAASGAASGSQGSHSSGTMSSPEDIEKIKVKVVLLFKRRNRLLSLIASEKIKATATQRTRIDELEQELKKVQEDLNKAKHLGEGILGVDLSSAALGASAGPTRS